MRVPPMKRLVIYTDASVIGGCEDSEYEAASLALWERFIQGTHTLALSAHTLREIRTPREVIGDEEAV